MCGINGYASTKVLNETEWLVSARDKMSYRGPDHAGLYISSNLNVAFGQRRLAIISLNEDSNQPLKVIHDGYEYVITFNGEIYNYRELRYQLRQQGFTFRTESDTEVIIAAYLHWGDFCVQRFEGMFAFVIHDTRRNRLFFARDIVGEKPFYYYRDSTSFFFSSEFLPLIGLSLFNNEISFTSILQYLELGYLPSDASFSPRIKKLPAGSAGYFDLSTGEFSFSAYFEIFGNNKVECSANTSLHRFDKLIEHSISGQLRGDVSVGVLLSGGVDSSIIACKASELSSNIINYTVDFGDNKEELENAKLISHKYGSRHEIFRFRELSVELFDDIIAKIDEPVADSSFVPTYLITEMINEMGGKVVLGGDGADELFGGYSLYSNWQIANKYLSILPRIVRNSLSMRADRPYEYNKYKYKKWAVCMNSESLFQVPNLRYVFSRKELAELSFTTEINSYSRYYNSQFSELNSLFFNLANYDLKNYLSSNILLKNDRSSMLNSLEMRAPFLNKKIIEFAFNDLLDNQKIRAGQTKVFLKEYSRLVFPEKYNYHSKRGFNFSSDLLIKDKWKAYFRDVIIGSPLKLFNTDYINYLLNSTDAAGGNHFVKIYSLLVLSKWIQQNNLKVRMDHVD
jgi:asparagine synthase (glutamine-hydrolysing)